MAEELTIAVLLILCLLWLAVLAPPVIRFLSGERRSVDSVGSFNETLSVLGRTNGHADRRGGDFARSTTPAQRRRRDVLFALGGAVAGSLVFAILVGGPFLWGLQIVTDALLAAYVVLLVQFRSRAREQHLKVHYLPAPPSSTREPALRRTAAR